MSKSGQAFVAKTQGHQFTLYAICKALGIPLTEEQEKFQAYLERTYPAVVEKEEPLVKVLNKRTDIIPHNAVYVDRSSKWGNPITIKELKELFPNDTLEELHEKGVSWYREYITTPFGRPKELLSQIGELKGKDLVCWCAPLPCHADVLLELVNKIGEEK